MQWRTIAFSHCLDWGGNVIIPAVYRLDGLLPMSHAHSPSVVRLAVVVMSLPSDVPRSPPFFISALLPITRLPQNRWEEASRYG